MHIHLRSSTRHTLRARWPNFYCVRIRLSNTSATASWEGIAFMCSLGRAGGISIDYMHVWGLRSRMYQSLVLKFGSASRCGTYTHRRRHRTPPVSWLVPPRGIKLFSSLISNASTVLSFCPSFSLVVFYGTQSNVHVAP